MGVLKSASDQLHEGFHTTVHYEQADVGRLVVHANPHELKCSPADVGWLGSTRVRPFVSKDTEGFPLAAVEKERWSHRRNRKKQQRTNSNKQNG